MDKGIPKACTNGEQKNSSLQSERKAWGPRAEGDGVEDLSPERWGLVELERAPDAKVEPRT